MDRSIYNKKMNELVKDEKTYKQIRRNPTTRIEKQVSESLKNLQRDGFIGESLAKRLNPQFSTPPQMYGLPKIHKEDIPMRPIVVTIGSPAYHLVKELARILSPLAGKTSSYVKNSMHFVEIIRGRVVSEADILVSFDVVSLFTKVPIDETMDVVKHKLQNDTSLEDRTPIPIEKLCELIKLCLTTSYFQLGEKFYEQREGTAMGSPLSPVIANLYMEHFEKLALDSSQL